MKLGPFENSRKAMRGGDSPRLEDAIRFYSLLLERKLHAIGFMLLRDAGRCDGPSGLRSFAASGFDLAGVGVINAAAAEPSSLVMGFCGITVLLKWTAIRSRSSRSDESERIEVGSIEVPPWNPIPPATSQRAFDAAGGGLAIEPTARFRPRIKMPEPERGRLVADARSLAYILTRFRPADGRRDDVQRCNTSFTADPNTNLNRRPPSSSDAERAV